jgi:hypothetical protein
MAADVRVSAYDSSGKARAARAWAAAALVVATALPSRADIGGVRWGSEVSPSGVQEGEKPRKSLILKW